MGALAALCTSHVEYQKGLPCLQRRHVCLHSARHEGAGVQQPGRLCKGLKVDVHWLAPDCLHPPTSLLKQPGSLCKAQTCHLRWIISQKACNTVQHVIP